MGQQKQSGYDRKKNMHEESWGSDRGLARALLRDHEKEQLLRY